MFLAVFIAAVAGAVLATAWGSMTALGRGPARWTGVAVVVLLGCCILALIVFLAGDDPLDFERLFAVKKGAASAKVRMLKPLGTQTSRTRSHSSTQLAGMPSVSKQVAPITGAPRPAAMSTRSKQPLRLATIPTATVPTARSLGPMARSW